jgi:HEAT repeat protein
MKKLQFSVTYTVVVVLLVVSPLLAWTGVVETLADQGMSSRSDLYRDAQRAMDQKDWPVAETLFGQVAEEGGQDADAAYYWQAYAQFKRGRRNEALKTLELLRHHYPESSWIDDAKALEMEAKPSSGRLVVSSSEEDEELKLYALNSLMHVESERAVPVLDEFLAGSHSVEMKEKALFVLSQSSSPRAREILVGIAKGQRQPELSMEAIEYLGLSGGKDTGELLQEIYDSNQDIEVKEQALEAMMLGGHKDRVLAAARGEHDPELREEAVGLLGVMGATEELRELYSSETSSDVKEGILEGMFIAGDGETLSQLARSEQDPEMRLAAIEYLGLVGGASAMSTLQSLYESESDPEVREQILEAFFLARDAETPIRRSKSRSSRPSSCRATYRHS